MQDWSLSSGVIDAEQCNVGKLANVGFMVVVTSATVLVLEVRCLFNR